MRQSRRIWRLARGGAFPAWFWESRRSLCCRHSTNRLGVCPTRASLKGQTRLRRERRMSFFSNLAHQISANATDAPRHSSFVSVVQLVEKVRGYHIARIDKGPFATEAV